MWSIGNEVPTQCSPEGYKVASFLQDICHREDPTSPVTCGMDQVTCVLANGFAAMIDVPGLNYRAHREVYHAAVCRTKVTVLIHDTDCDICQVLTIGRQAGAVGNQLQMMGLASGTNHLFFCRQPHGKLLGEGCRKISRCCQWRCYQPRFVPSAQDAGFQRSADGYCAEWRASR